MQTVEEKLNKLLEEMDQLRKQNKLLEDKLQAVSPHISTHERGELKGVCGRHQFK